MNTSTYDLNILFLLLMLISTSVHEKNSSDIYTYIPLQFMVSTSSAYVSFYWDKTYIYVIYIYKAYSNKFAFLWNEMNKYDKEA